MEAFEYYKMVRNNIQLVYVELESLKCLNRGKGQLKEDNNEVKINLQRKASLISETKADISLKAMVGFPEKGPFVFEIVYRGICESKQEIEKDDFQKYAHDQVVPLLLPYVRECVASTIARMGLPIFTLPTMDVLNSFEQNMDSDQE